VLQGLWLALVVCVEAQLQTLGVGAVGQGYMVSPRLAMRTPLS